MFIYVDNSNHDYSSIVNEGNVIGTSGSSSGIGSWTSVSTTYNPISTVSTVTTAEASGTTTTTTTTISSTNSPTTTTSRSTDTTAVFDRNGDNNYYFTGTSASDAKSYFTGNSGSSDYYFTFDVPVQSNDGYTYLNGQLAAISYDGMFIAPPLEYNNSISSVVNGTIIVGNQYFVTSTNATQNLDKYIFDNRYFYYSDSTGQGMIDLETLEKIPCKFDYVNSSYPVAQVLNSSYPTASEVTGAVFGSGFNAGYTTSGAQFVGLQMNGMVMTHVPKAASMPVKNNPIQTYCTFGTSAQSASYCGNDPMYTGTTLATDSSNNIIIPISYTSEIINGYSNNDLIRNGTTVSPLMYYNINTKIYGYYLLSFMENVTGAFSLHGQTFTVDDDNIYSTTYSSGVLQSGTAVAYKKNLTLLGTLSTCAVFWSAFNKSFYAFTGDRVLSKMFEASRINSINYVGQNPSTQSLWIGTDDGVYIMSDSDTYKLNYNIVEKPSFVGNYAILTTKETESNTTTTTRHDVSLYNIGNNAIHNPIKLKTAFYGVGSEHNSVMDCWYIRLHDDNRSDCDVKLKVNTITNISKSSEEKTVHISPSDYDDNNIYYLKYQPKYQECVAMQLELESPIAIYSIAVGANTNNTVPQASKFNF